MSHSFVDQFESQILEEIDEVFSELQAKKKTIHELLDTYFQNEKEFDYFVDQYKREFEDFEQRRKELLYKIRELETASEPQRNDDVLDQLMYDDEDEDEESSEADLYDDIYELEDIDGIFDSSPEEERQLDVPGQRKRSGKSIIAQSFRWIYHYRDTDEYTEFHHERDRKLSDLVDDPRYSEVDILMRMPFTSEDQDLWKNPLPKIRDGSSVESPGERLYRLRLWNWLLDKGVKEAESLADSNPHELYPLFLTWAESEQNITIFLQDTKVERANELVELEQELNRLQELES